MRYSPELEEAMLDLVRETDPRYKRAVLDSAVQWNRAAPVRFTGELSKLNPILELMLNDEKTFAEVSMLIDGRRAAAGLEMMWPPEEPEKFDKVANQRRIMAERRARSGRALQLENRARGERNQLYGNARLEFERTVLAGWGRRLDRTLDAARTRAGGRISKEETARIRAAHWANIDAELDEMEQQLRDEGKL